MASSVAGLITLKSRSLMGVNPSPIDVKLAALLHAVVPDAKSYSKACTLWYRDWEDIFRFVTRITKRVRNGFQSDQRTALLLQDQKRL